MTIRPMIILNTDAARAQAARWCHAAPAGSVVEWREQKRSDEQSRKMWAMLGDIARQARHHGLKLSKDDWKQIAIAAIHKEARLVPNWDGDGFIALERSSSALSVREMSDLIEMLYLIGETKGVAWSDPSVIRDNPRESAA
jgi:hypothetical protein